MLRSRFDFLAVCLFALVGSRQVLRMGHQTQKLLLHISHGRRRRGVQALLHAKVCGEERRREKRRRERGRGMTHGGRENAQQTQQRESTRSATGRPTTPSTRVNWRKQHDRRGCAAPHAGSPARSNATDRRSSDGLHWEATVRALSVAHVRQTVIATQMPARAVVHVCADHIWR